jgi:eukaryotic-like serine/threonine-protein kinase
LKQGDREGSLQDRERSLRGEPRDERDWTARGMERQPRDPQGVLADYQGALKLDPRCLTALQDVANVLGENLRRTEDAIATLLGFWSHYVPARARRGVSHGRLGHREAAHADAREALLRDGSPLNTYQVASIYALTSRQNPDDRYEALRLLSSALRRGFDSELLDRDHDLDAIRADPEFDRLIEATRAQRRQAKFRHEEIMTRRRRLLMPGAYPMTSSAVGPCGTARLSFA